jgi:hypothetical protein
MVNLRTQIQSKTATNNSDANAGSGKICLTLENTFARDTLYAPLRHPRNKGTTNDVQQTFYQQLSNEMQQLAVYLFTARSLYVYRVSSHPSSGVHKTVTTASGTGHINGSVTKSGQVQTWPRWNEVTAPII